MRSIKPCWHATDEGGKHVTREDQKLAVEAAREIFGEKAAEELRAKYGLPAPEPVVIDLSAVRKARVLPARSRQW